MIITRLKGGLGNQMFQYACGRALAIRNGDVLKLDISGFGATENTDTPRYYSLSSFNIQENLATGEEIENLRNPHGIFSKISRRIAYTVFDRKYTGWDPILLSKKKNIYLDGFWQTEKCFSDCEDIIKKEFTLKKPLSTNAQKAADTIAVNGQSGEPPSTSSPSVSIHVRRGDVARDAATNQYYGITTPEYYSRAIDYIAQTLTQKSMRVFVFSDDVEWVKNNIKINFPTTYVSDGIISDCEEIVLMSMCDHNIIANSSFSWWGAWLNKNQNKIVVGPKDWIKTGKHRHKDITPSSWIRI